MKLRGHHLICFQFFRGEGYSKIFVENAKKIAEYWEKNPAETVNHADDICGFCPFLRNGKCSKYEDIEKNDELALKLLGLNVGDKVRKGFVKKQLPKILNEWKEKACKNCEWKKLCVLEYKNITSNG
ncbi:MAG: DUF1284 domain-containing protein [Thermoplasmatales archaeon]|nr:DUF1284 domain-containing protein [Thermoplasmatales archaeon]